MYKVKGRSANRSPVAPRGIPVRRVRAVRAGGERLAFDAAIAPLIVADRGRPAPPSGERGGLMAIVQPQLSQNVADVVLDRALGYVEELRNLLVG